MGKLTVISGYMHKIILQKKATNKPQIYPLCQDVDHSVIQECLCGDTFLSETKSFWSVADFQNKMRR